MEGIKKPPLFQRENSDPIAQRAIRIVSMDSATFQAKKTGSFKRKKSHRSLSAGETSTNHFMSPLSFENIDLVSTPLSSLRSCSEYQRINSNRNENKGAHADGEKKGFWSRLSFWSKSNQAAKKSKLKVRFAEDTNDDEKSFLVERLRFNQANLMEGEDYNYGGQPSIEPLPKVDTPRKPAIRPSFMRSTAKKPVAASTLRSSHASIMHESSMAFDYLFGVNVLSKSNHQPMEIELKNLKEPQVLSLITENIEVNEGETYTEPESATLRRVNSHRSFASLDRLSIDTPMEIYVPIQHQPEPSPPRPFQINRSDTWRPYALLQWSTFIDFLRMKFPPTHGDDMFYESIRIQPFSSGAYLRGMLLAGMSSMVFQVYNFMTWSTIVGGPIPNNNFILRILYINLIFQILLNAAQLPFRLRIHFSCWEASRAVEVDTAISTIRTMLLSESWLMNKLLGRCIDFLSIFSFLITEFYLFWTHKQDPLRNVVVSLCATNLLTLVSRIVVATIFSLSMHDPHILSEARRRGLSKWDLERLPSFVFTCREEVNNEDCSICLCNFEMGEMLTCLPCDKKHNFHANCIRQWLQRQNSCPLCQKLV